jgi:putative transposase
LACRIVGQPRGTQRYVPTLKPDEDELTRNIVFLASEYGRYGYRRVTALLNAGGIEVGKDRVQRIWRREGLKVPKKQPKRSRLWLNDGSCIRLRPAYPNHVWSFDFVEARTNDGRRLRLMTLIDEFSGRCLAIHVARRINALDVIETLADVMLFPAYIQSDNAKVPAAVAEGIGQREPLHRARIALGERILRIVQWQAARRAAQWRDLLQT